ncbi:MAG: 2-succinyl-5-enolpyruvyl-6-hydroxy-3-cyclohexene-1-carboxylate synthase, partial [Verrucomicrobia bacterium]|nr:2-succinyl-5-enolpyruvyl-6-hydroxy-3-cyclohexene-1-carboxylate synthase [Verrucomicrobiota bacterium]
MYSDKLNVQILVSLLIEHQISHIVLCPGSRNSPLTHTISQHPFFKCFSIFDERSAAFFAIGLSQKLQRPTAICCTSGTALLN